MKIKSIKKKRYSGNVYNIGMEGNTQIENSYYANGVLVANCRCVWLPITQEEIDDPRYEDTDYSMGGDTLDRSPSVKDVAAMLGGSGKLQTFCDCH